MRVSREIKDEGLGQFLQDVDEDILRSLLDQFNEDNVIAGLGPAIHGDGLKLHHSPDNRSGNKQND
jgi:hypothetical protein